MSETKQVFSALVKAQRAFGPVLKDKNNPAFKGSKYADLGACIDAVMGPLNEAGIAVIQKQHPHEGGVCVETVFLHESGESYSAGMLTVPAAKQDPQGYGSALTYARRYSLMAACGMAPEDDDGNASVKGQQAEAKRIERNLWLEQQRKRIFDAPTVGALKTVLGNAVAIAMSENDGSAVDQLNAWRDEKAAQAKAPKAGPDVGDGENMP